jgi:hypothetical protein
MVSSAHTPPNLCNVKKWAGELLTTWWLGTGWRKAYGGRVMKAVFFEILLFYDGDCIAH